MTEQTETPVPGDYLDCGDILAGMPRGSVGTGYARTDDGRVICYAHAEQEERDAMRAADDYVAYVSGDGFHVTTWSGGHLARIVQRGRTAQGQYTWHAVGPGGHYWYGRNAGPGMVVHLRRAAVPAATQTGRKAR